MIPSLLVDLYAALCGLVVGSYLNVVIHRLPARDSTVVPASHCPHCGARIRAPDNLPLLSFLLLRGRCRDCGARISWRYPAVELGTAILFAAIAARFGASLDALAAALFGALLLALAGIDLEHYLLPDRLTLPGIAFGLLAQPLLSWGSLSAALAGALGGAGVLLTFAGAWYLLRQHEGMGLGDVKMAAAIGAFLGWKGMALALFGGAFAGAIVGLLLVATGRGRFGSRLPFGVFLAAGGLVALFVGPAPVNAYLALL